MTEREALKLALDKFKHLWEIGIDAEYKVELLPEINAIKEALAQPEQKPVAWLYIEPDNTYLNVHYDDVDVSQFPNDEWFPVYKSTPQRNETLEEVAKRFDAMPFGDTAASFAKYVRDMKE